MLSSTVLDDGEPVAYKLIDFVLVLAGLLLLARPVDFVRRGEGKATGKDGMPVRHRGCHWRLLASTSAVGWAGLVGYGWVLAQIRGRAAVAVVLAGGVGGVLVALIAVLSSWRPIWALNP